MSEAEIWLLDWHSRHTGATSRTLGRGTPSSYERLASFARAGDRALDLACGDGMLLELLLERGVHEAAGVDMSEAELSAARARLGGRAELVRGRAQALPFADVSFDVVTCHLALMLMDSPEQVVSEVRRVLRPGGTFAAVVGGPPAGDGAWRRVITLFVQAGLSGPALGDPRTTGEAGLREVLSALSDVRVEPIVVDVGGSEDEVWAMFAETYMPDMVSPDRLAELERAARAVLRDLALPDGRIPCELSWLCASGKR